MTLPASPMNSSLEERRRLLKRAYVIRQESTDLAQWTLGCRRVGGRPFDFRGHEYLHGPYSDPAAGIVIRKAAQTGATEYGIARALQFAIQRGGRTIYYFPTDHAVSEFSRDRFAPAIRESPYFRALVGEIDAAGLRQIGKGSIYFRGTNSRTQMKSVPADFLVFDEVDEMPPASIELARKRTGHSDWGHELYISTPTLPGYGIDKIFQASDQRHWHIRCPGCGKSSCLEDLFLKHHGNPYDARREIVFIQGKPGQENLVCVGCGHVLDPACGVWVPKYPGRATHGYHFSKFFSKVLSRADIEQGCETKASALLREWQMTDFPQEFYNSELGLPYLAAEGGLTEQDLKSISGNWTMRERGKGCVMGVDQNRGLHIVIKQPDENQGVVFTLRVHHEPQTDADFSHLDHFMEAYDVRACVIDALPGTQAASAFAHRFRGRVWCAYYTAQKGKVAWSYDSDNTPIVNINRTDALDAWRDVHQMGKRRIPRIEDEVTEFVRQMTNTLRSIQEDPMSGQKRAVWIKRGPDHFAHADSYAEIALERLHAGEVTATILG
jgi:hypothetical protein